MKRILLSSVLFLAGYIGCMAAHDYIPYVADGKEWVEYTPAGTPAYFRYTIDGTAEIEGKEYQLMTERRYAPMETPSYTDGEPIYVREENKRVYIYRNGQEELIYDFNLEAGDAVAATGDAGEYTIHVDSVVEREVAGKLHNFYYVWYESDNFPNSPGTDKLCDTWVEGIGAVNIAILHSNGRFGQSGTAVFSYYREPSTDFVYPEGHDVIDFSSVNAVMTDAVLRRDGSLLSCNGRLTLYDLGGRHVADGSTIDLARLPRGVYVAKAELSGGTTAVAKVVW